MTTAAPKDAATKPDRKVISIDFTDHEHLYAKITKFASNDERSPASWLRRHLKESLDNAHVPESAASKN